MSTLDLLARLNAAGVAVEIVGGDALQLRGRACPPDLKAEAGAYKAAILALLREHRIGERDPHRAIHAVRRYVVQCRNLACPILGQCARQLTADGCPNVEPQTLEDAA